MNFFKVVLLVGTLVGMLGAKSCPGGGKAGVTETQVDDEIGKLATTSSTVEAQKQELKAAVRKYESVIVGSVSVKELSIYEEEKVTSPYIAAEVDSESAITTVEQAAATDEPSSELEKKESKEYQAYEKYCAKIWEVLYPLFQEESRNLSSESKEYWACVAKYEASIEAEVINLKNDLSQIEDEFNKNVVIDIPENLELNTDPLELSRIGERN